MALTKAQDNIPPDLMIQRLSLITAVLMHKLAFDEVTLTPLDFENFHRWAGVPNPSIDDGEPTGGLITIMRQDGLLLKIVNRKECVRLSQGGIPNVS